mgnify:CR=1 FL=1
MDSSFGSEFTPTYGPRVLSKRHPSAAAAVAGDLFLRDLQNGDDLGRAIQKLDISNNKTLLPRLTTSNSAISRAVAKDRPDYYYRYYIRTDDNDDDSIKNARRIISFIYSRRVRCGDFVKISTDAFVSGVHRGSTI